MERVSLPHYIHQWILIATDHLMELLSVVLIQLLSLSQLLHCNHHVAVHSLVVVEECSRYRATTEQLKYK
jgi:hypothetical protein